MAKNENIDIIFSFDTTGSMYACLSRLRRQVENTVNLIFDTVENVNIGLIAHGDYCDAGDTYVTKHHPLSNDRRSLVNFIKTVEPTGGGDSPECYELVLHEARSFNWRPGKAKALVVIGDDVPHGPNYNLNTKNLDWRNEIRLLMEMGINVYGVQALNRRHATEFYKEIARETGGYHLNLDQFESVSDLLLAICYKQDSNEAVQKYAQVVEQQGRMSRGLDTVFSTLTGTKSTRYKAKSDKAVEMGRFQVMEVDHDQRIDEFVRDHGMPFQLGKGFYQWSKPEIIQDHKQVILVDNRSKDTYTGNIARGMLGLPIGYTTNKIKPTTPPHMTAFIQSTAPNRKLKANTKLLYEWAS